MDAHARPLPKPWTAQSRPSTAAENTFHNTHALHTVVTLNQILEPARQTARCGRIFDIPPVPGGAAAILWQMEARQLSSQGLRITDRHNTVVPISLAIPTSREPLNVGECVRQWRHQASVHALTHAPECLCLQLMRLRQVSGTWFKADNPTWLPPGFAFPVFRNQHDLEVEFVEYVWLTDDATHARKIGSITEMLSRQAYLIWGMRVQHPRTGPAVGPTRDATQEAPATQTPHAPRMRTCSYAEVEGVARAGGTLHFATWRA